MTTPCGAVNCTPFAGTCDFTIDEARNGQPCQLPDLCASPGVCNNGACETEYDACPCLPDNGNPDDPNGQPHNTWSQCHFYDDGNLCDGSLTCIAGTDLNLCRPDADPVICPDDGNPCARTTCNPTTGQCESVGLPAKTGCDDGNECTIYDRCEAGSCFGKWTNACPCARDADCSRAQDTNLCNGAETRCDIASGNCVARPGTEVVCQDNPATPCWTNVCNPDSGVCEPQWKPKDTPCPDSNPCSINEHCEMGICRWTLNWLADPNSCRCTTVSDCNIYNTGHPCNGLNICELSGANKVCKFGTIDGQLPLCDDQDPCTIDDVCSSINGTCLGGGIEGCK